ncbi:MAG: RNA methyltransferase [Oscillospiraceae bacterium]|jgi:TrmH family RNA methyltransferase|nr:RNA methyltransferase [Oscillospiraceae bacterium]
MSIEISSKDNAAVKNAVKLRTSSKERSEQSSFFIEGLRLCTDALESKISILQLFYTEPAAQKNHEAIQSLSAAAKDAYLVSEELAEKLADTVNSQGIFCVCEATKHPSFLENPGSGRYIALENIQDPSNMGNILRTTEALGLDAAILSSDCCDIYNPKVIRGSMGALFRLPIVIVPDFSKYIKKLRQEGLRPLAAVPDSDASKISAIRFFKGVVMCVGNEGNGLTEQAITACGERVNIPMSENAESLNAATSAAILMWEMVRAD